MMKMNLIKLGLVAFGATALFQACTQNRHISDYAVNNRVERHVTGVADTTYLTQLYRTSDNKNDSYLEVSKFKDKEGEKIILVSDLKHSHKFDSFSKVHYLVIPIDKAKQVRDYCSSVENWERNLPADSKELLPQTEINYQIDKNVFISLIVSYQYSSSTDESNKAVRRQSAFIDEMDVWMNGRRHRVHIDKFIKSLQGLGE